MREDPPPCDSPLVRVVEAVLIAGLSALFTGLVERWLERKGKKAKRKPKA